MRNTTQRREATRPWLAIALAALLLTDASAQQTLTIAAFPAVDEIVRAAIPQWKRTHPTVDIKVVSRQFSDHHTAMTTALSTSFYLPDVMALEVGYVGRFAQGGGLEDLSRAPYNIRQFQSRYVPYAFAQATSRKGTVAVAPAAVARRTPLARPPRPSPPARSSSTARLQRLPTSTHSPVGARQRFTAKRQSPATSR